MSPARNPADQSGTDREPRTVRGRRTREGLVVAARAVFERKGFAASTMSDIAAEAGVSHGTVYTYFTTKEDILAAAVTRLVADLRESIRAVDLADPVQRIANANERYVSSYLTHARLMRVVEEAATGDGRFSEILDELRRSHVNRVAVQIARQQDSGAAHADVSPQTAAAALCAMVEGFARHWADNGGPTSAADLQTLTLLWLRSLGLPDIVQQQHQEDSNGIHV